MVNWWSGPSPGRPSFKSTLLITLAAVFRLGLFPLHLGLPAEVNIRQGLGTLLRLIPAAVVKAVAIRSPRLAFRLILSGPPETHPNS